MLKHNLHIFLSQWTRWIGKRHNVYVVFGRVKFAISSKQLVHERRVILPFVNLLLERMVFATLQVKS
jgi:hypothetical protein